MDFMAEEYDFFLTCQYDDTCPKDLDPSLQETNKALDYYFESTLL